MTDEELHKGIREVVRPFDNAETSREFAAAQKAIRDWLKQNNVSAFQTDYVPSVVHGLWLNETIAQGEEENSVRLGLTEEQVRERRRIDKIVGEAYNTQIRTELDAARALMEDWFTRFPTDMSVSSWRTGLDTQQMFLDIKDQVEADERVSADRAAARVAAQERAAAARVAAQEREAAEQTIKADEKRLVSSKI